MEKYCRAVQGTVDNMAHAHCMLDNKIYRHTFTICRLRLKCDGTRAETIFRLSAKRTSPFKSARASVQSTTVSRGVSISGSNAGYTMFRGSVKSTGYPLHSPVSPSLPLPCVPVCHQFSKALKYLPLFHCNNGYANAPQCYVYAYIDSIVVTIGIGVLGRC